jgi:hypothetical protein
LASAFWKRAVSISDVQRTLYAKFAEHFTGRFFRMTYRAACAARTCYLVCIEFIPAALARPKELEPCMHRHTIPAVFFLVLLASTWAAPQATEQDWTRYARIGAYGLASDNVGKIVADAKESDVFGIEVDNDIPGRYESFVDPKTKLTAIRAVADKAHAAGNHAVVYIAGTECITANADKTSHTLAKEHPDWLQRKINGDPAIFGSGSAFWIAKGDEDVWITPYAPEWRKIYMQRVRQIAATGIDGIYIDIPYWMTHFDGWEETWASFDDYTVFAFKKQTGLDAKKDLKLGDLSDPNFRRWIDFRIQTITDFIQEIGQNAKSVNPQIKIIPEIYPGIESEAVRVGADVYSLYPVVDAIAHEYEFGSGDHMASSRTPLDWFRYQIGMHTFRAFAQGKATWILNYSWDGDKNVNPRQAMMNLAMSEVMAGANFWDAPGHSMAGSNDPETRKKIFAWIAQHEETFYLPRTPIDPVGVYFSPETRDFYAEDFIRSYAGILILLMQSHREFQVVTPRTLDGFHGETLVLPDVRLMSEREQHWMEQYVKQGKRLVITGDSTFPVGNQTNVSRFLKCPGKAYSASLEADFEQANPGMQQAFLDSLAPNQDVEVFASPSVATSVAEVDGTPHVFLANFAGLVGGKNPVQTLQTNVKISIQAGSNAVGFFLPFLADVQKLQGTEENGRLTFTLPPISKGGVFWYGQ